MKKIVIVVVGLLIEASSSYAQSTNKGVQAMEHAKKEIKEQTRKMTRIITEEVPKAAGKVRRGDMDEFKILSPAEFNALKKTIVETADSISPKAGIIRDSTSTKYIDMIKRFFKWLSE